MSGESDKAEIYAKHILLRFLAPFAASLIVLIVFRALVPQSIPPSTEYADAIKSALIAGHTAPPSSVVLMKPFAWTASALALCALFITTAFLSIYTIWRSFTDTGINRRKMLVTLAVIIPAVIAFFLEGPFRGEWTVAEHSLQVITMKKITEHFSQPPFTMTMNVLAMWETLSLVLALCSLSIPIPALASSPEVLIRRKRLATGLLYLGAMTLTTAVVQISLLVSLPGNARILNVSEPALSTLAAGAAMIGGTFYTVLLVAMFAPVVIFLSADLARAAEGKTTIEERRAWLAEHGLASTWRQQAVRIAALLGPILTGWLGEPLAKAFTSIIGG